jgi:hypothetical protein
VPSLNLGIVASGYAYPNLIGGVLTSDSTYYYRTFTANGTLTVENQSAPIDYFVIAGGGSGGAGFTAFLYSDGFNDYYDNKSGGGGAAGIKAFFSSNLTVGNHSVVIGAGGGGADGFAAPGPGSNSSIGSIVTVTAGGQGFAAGGSGGSNADFSGAAGNGSTGGGGAGTNGNASGINGGAAFSAFGTNYGLGGSSRNSLLTVNGSVGSSGVFAPENSGSGGGGGLGGGSGGFGGSGIVIIRYLRSAVGG